jgi:hypothetical protein
VNLYSLSETQISPVQVHMNSAPLNSYFQTLAVVL